MTCLPSYLLCLLAVSQGSSYLVGSTRPADSADNWNNADTEDMEDIVDTVNTKDNVDIMNTEDMLDARDTEDTENRKGTEDTVATENTRDTVDSKDIIDTEDTKDATDTEDIVESEDSMNIENTVVTDDIENSVHVNLTANIESIVQNDENYSIYSAFDYNTVSIENYEEYLDEKLNDTEDEKYYEYVEYEEERIWLNITEEGLDVYKVEFSELEEGYLDDFLYGEDESGDEDDYGVSYYDLDGEYGDTYIYGDWEDSDQKDVYEESYDEYREDHITEVDIESVYSTEGLRIEEVAEDDALRKIEVIVDMRNDKHLEEDMEMKLVKLNENEDIEVYNGKDIREILEDVRTMNLLEEIQKEKDDYLRFGEKRKEGLETDGRNDIRYDRKHNIGSTVGGYRVDRGGNTGQETGKKAGQEMEKLSKDVVWDIPATMALVHSRNMGCSISMSIILLIITVFIHIMWMNLD